MFSQSGPRILWTPDVWGFSTHTNCISLFFIAVIKHSSLGNVERKKAHSTPFWRRKVQGQVAPFFGFWRGTHA